MEPTVGIRNFLRRTNAKIQDAIAREAVLSPSQLEEVDAIRTNYLSALPNPGDPEAIALTERYLAANAIEVYNAYLPQLKQLYSPIDKDAEYGGDFDTVHNIRFVHLTRWVSSKEEDSLDKLVSVYEVLSNEPCNIALVFHRSVESTDVYLAVIDLQNSSNNVDVNDYAQRIVDALRGNFPGSEWDDEIGEGPLPCIDRWSPYSVATVSNLPTEKSESFKSQTIEKLLDGIVPMNPEDEYTLVLIASPVGDARDRQLRLEEIYTSLVPMSEWRTSFSYNENEAISSQATAGVNLGVSVGSQIGQSYGASTTDGTSLNVSDSKSDSYSHSEAETEGSGAGLSVGASAKLGPLNAHLDGSLNRFKSSSVAETIGRTLGRTVGRAINTARTTSDTISRGINSGANFGLNFARSSSVMATIGSGESIDQNFKNYTVKHALEQLEQQMKRIDLSLALGMWDFAAYVVSESPDIANNVAHSYLALTQGEESYLSESAINLWRGDIEGEGEVAHHICSYLRELRHPLFGLNPEVVKANHSFCVYPDVVTATTSLSGKELAFSLNFPKKSIAGLPVFECAEFARNVSTFDHRDLSQPTIDVGNIYHMHRLEPTRVQLDLNSLALHTFVTGSTGAGKTNTTALILDEAKRQGVRFLVVEPAKGEYKDLFGNYPDVRVFGTNPELTPLLRINPFSFPKSIHVLEHLDRLIEIFNVCWPMYAAMPAVLKDAIQRSYEDCGWDMTMSTNSYGEDLYPNFADVERNVRSIIESSEYDAENKGAYKGSLITRLNSLGNGINGLLFTEDEIDPNALFDSNVIVDLSRIGSSETKSLIMGLLVLKLQEHRMIENVGMNLPLKHLTVLEEAHNLLKRTSTEQPMEGGNLIGKSVEMLANAIAEMRTYGEGFVIADQAPGLLDLSVIRNTNTKIVMRLPDLEDRKLVGYAIGLNEDQIIEISKLPRGVAAIYQNDWIEAVLCKIDQASLRVNPYRYDKMNDSSLLEENPTDRSQETIRIAQLIAMNHQLSEDELQELSLALSQLNLNASMRTRILKYLDSPHESVNLLEIAPFMSALFPNIRRKVVQARAKTPTPKAMTDAAREELANMSDNELIRRTEQVILQAIITDYLFLELQDIDGFRDWRAKGGLS